MRGIYNPNFCNSVGISFQNSSRGTVVQKCFSLEFKEVTDIAVLTTGNIRRDVLKCSQEYHLAGEVRSEYRDVWYFFAARSLR
jgi:hypothetical protein